MEEGQKEEATVVLPEILAEFMVDVKCGDCEDSIRNKLRHLQGVKNVEVDSREQVVRVLGTSPVKSIIQALNQTGLTAKLIGQGLPHHHRLPDSAPAAVAEFRGPSVFGVVRIVHIDDIIRSSRIEAAFTGLTPGTHHPWSINQFGDLSRGAATAGGVFHPDGTGTAPAGDLGMLIADDDGEAFYLALADGIRVSDVIGRSVVVYGGGGGSSGVIAAAVIGRSAGVGHNYRNLCNCDGTTIWEQPSLVNSKL